MSINCMQLTELPCHGSGYVMRRVGTGSDLQPEPRQAIRS
jgi:hypothetical protein